MNQMATNQTYSMLVSEEDISKAMYILSALPSRVQSDRTLFKEVYFRALHGVSRHSLEVAVQNIIQGHSELQHGFLPSPPELRRECERVMKPILDSMAYVREVEKAKAEAVVRHRNRSKADNTKGRSVLATGIDHGTWVSSGKRDYPVGSVWCAKTGAVYSPLPTVVPPAASNTRFVDIPDQPIKDTFKQVGAA